MKIKRMVLGGLANNTYIVIGQDGVSAVLVDPAYEAERIIEFLTGQGLELKAMLITHGHFDHIGAVSKIVEHTGVAVVAHEEEAKIMSDSIKNLSTYFTSRGVTAEANQFISDKEVVDFGSDLRFKAIVVPGHSPKSTCYYSKDAALVFTGDTLFSGSMGRTDYYNGDSHDLVKNIKERLLFLPGETVVYPGHGETTTITNEKHYNPYLK